MSATDERENDLLNTEAEANAQESYAAGIPADNTDEVVQTAAPQSAPEAGSYDYVVPKQPYKKKKKRKKKHSGKHAADSKTDSGGGVEYASDGFVFARPRKKHRLFKHRHRSRRKHLKGWKKVLVIIVSVILALIIALGATYLIMCEIGRSRMHDLDDAEITAPTENDSIDVLDPKGQLIKYNGKYYELNKDIFSITVLGVDNSDIIGYDSKMADAIYILAVDTKTGKMKILGVSRDTMADVDVYSLEGRYVDTEKKQISFSYSYSSDEVTGGANTSRSLSRLFFGLPLNNYFAIDMDALVTLNDAIGGVTLTSLITFTSPEDGRTISGGETVTLHGKEAERYVRQRDSEVLESNNDRMKRQQQYIKAFINSVIPAVKEDISRISSLYNMISENSESNMNLADIVYMSSVVLPKIKDLDEIEYVTLQGEITKGEYAEMNVSNDDALKAMLDVFYRPLS